MNVQTHPPPALNPPEPREIHRLALSDGATMVLRRHGNPDGPGVALSHGNGMAIEAYYPFWRLMLADYDLVLFDTRNHGQNPADGSENHNWDRFREDFETVRAAIDRLFGAGPAAAVFHSMSGISALLQTRAYGGRWAPLILIDPPIFPPDGHRLQRTQTLHMKEMTALALRRPDRFGDPEELAAVLRKRPAFRRWQPGAHELFARATTRRTEGGWTLACPKSLEAQIFADNIDPTIWPVVGAMPGDIAVVGADVTLPEVQPPALLGRALAEDHGLPYTMIADCTHFLQVERPEAVWRAVEAFFRRFGHAA